jgi:hypothetical protein
MNSFIPFHIVNRLLVFCQYVLDYNVKLIFYKLITVFDKDITSQFTGLVDDLILSFENDAKFAEIIKWVDVQSQKNGMSFYEMVYIITDKQLTKKRAQQWLSQNMHPSRNQ